MNSPTTPPKENFYSHLARFFVENKQLSLLLTLASFAFGFLAFLETPKQYNPEITLPAFRVVTEYPGATADEVERQVTNEVENKLAEIPGVDEMSSVSFSGGKSVVTVIFEIGTDLDASKTEVIQKIQANLHLAPMGVRAPLIQQVDPENVPVMTIAISSEDTSEEGLRMFAYDLKEELKTVPGVTNIEVKGGRTRALSVWLDPERMTAAGLSAADVIRTIEANNIRINGGALEGAVEDIPVEVDGNLTTKEDLARLVVGGTPLAPVAIEDVGRVEDGYASTRQMVGSATAGTSTSSATVFLSFAKTQGENITSVTGAVEQRLEELKEGSVVPDGVTLAITRNEGETAREEIAMLTEHLAFAIGIVTITLIFFLGLRAALVVATAIPLTLALVFIAGYFFDQTINRITLFALIFSLGLLVDDAIVVIENIYRHFSHKKESKTDAIAHATGEVGMGVLLSTVTAVVVFVPMGLVTGMMGAYMGPIAFFAPVARLMSLFVAYTLSPYIASLFLKEGHAGDSIHAEGEQHSKLELLYSRFIHRLLDDRRLQNRILLGTLGIVVVAFLLPVFEFVHFRMLPKADKEQFAVWIDMPDTTALPKTVAFTSAVKEVLLGDPTVRSVEYFIGTAPVTDFNGLFRGSDMRVASNQASMKVALTPTDARTEKSEEIVARLRRTIAEEVPSAADVRVRLVEDPPGPPVLSTLLVRVKGPNKEVREDIARDLSALFRETEGVVDVDSTLSQGAMQERIVIDHEKLTRSGLAAAQVAEAVTTALSGTPVAIAHLESREHTAITVRFDEAARDELNDLSRISVRSTTGQLVPLGSVARIETAQLPEQILHDNRETVTMVMGETDGRSVVYVVKDLIKELRSYRLPGGTGELEDWNLYGLTFRDTVSHEVYRLEWGGEFEMTLDNFRDLGIAMLVSYFLIYLILVAQFRSFRSPGLIMSTIVLGFAGVLPGFALLDATSGMYFSATSMIGAIALGGIVVGNAILLLDFIEQLRRRGQSTKMAIIGACQTRLRPIMLTSITAILGSVVIVTDPVWSGLAWAIVFGLSLSTILTLVIFPVLYYRYGTGETMEG